MIALRNIVVCCIAQVFLALMTTGCAPKDVLVAGEQAHLLMPDPEHNTAPPPAYRLGPQDVVSVTVFQEPELSLKDIPIETSGSLPLALIGPVQAAGLTTGEFAAEVERRYAAKYLVDPRVLVTVTTAQSQQVTVEGNVMQAGRFPVTGRLTLLGALALAKGPTRVASLDEVVIFRVIDGQRQGALFDVDAIRKGRAPDPEIRGNDTVVVGFDTIKGAYRDFLVAAPIFNIFRDY